VFNSPQRPEMGREHFAVPLAFDPVFAAISHWLGGARPASCHDGGRRPWRAAGRSVDTSAASRKYAGPMIAGDMTASCFTSSLPRLSKRCTAPRGMHSACPGPTAMGVPSTVQVRTPSMP